MISWGAQREVEKMETGEKRKSLESWKCDALNYRSRDGYLESETRRPTRTRPRFTAPCPTYLLYSLLFGGGRAFF
jgi:hypothetical protein